MTDIEKLFAATRYYKKEQGVTKTCQTCKHWSNNLKKKPKFVSASMGKCKKIFENLTTFDIELERYLLDFFEDLTTRDTFGCNGYERENNGNL